jgi:hypothetical protein
MKREPSLLGAFYICERCNGDDPLEVAKFWVEPPLALDFQHCSAECGKKRPQPRVYRGRSARRFSLMRLT